MIRRLLLSVACAAAAALHAAAAGAVAPTAGAGAPAAGAAAPAAGPGAPAAGAVHDRSGRAVIHDASTTDGVSARASSGSALDAILRSLARPAPAATPFIEARFSPLLSRPLVVSGQLRYLGPGSLARIVRKPYRERAEIRGDTVTIQRGEQPPQTFSLDRVPQMRSLVASFSALLGGNVAALRSAFALDLHGDERDWTIGLTPLDPRVHSQIRSILVTGGGSEPRCLTTFQANDDTDVMLLARAAQGPLPTAPDRAWFDARCHGASRG